ncbi:uncharacterized protein JN550_002836 [Neoarthrinium moseri]|uniref:uncharacterized protein n=1 Tax=Neoarthrinium moseri TaxID=1658444 RepID=UPI001FDD1350|nr:uncharacterized protein JN550_002836 [Neoarthrinium moseri]KAI1874257.1 hypothetical protein JN550_002836 [Neoarthrinium moseri]
MGYTHYYYVIDNQIWDTVLPILNNDLQLIIEAADIPIESQSYHNVFYDSARGIDINGINDDSCEPLLIPPASNKTGQILGREYVAKWSTKTASKPYDLTVTLLLLRLKQLAGVEIELCSDGRWDEWLPARALYAALWPNESLECPFKEVRPNTLRPSLNIRPPPDAPEWSLEKPLSSARAAERLALCIQKFKEYSFGLNQALEACTTSQIEHRLCAPGIGFSWPLDDISFRLVDTERNCVVENSTGHTFVALSYVWGNACQLRLTNDTHLQLLTEGALDINGLQPSQTIIEAIAVCRILKQRYIWIDSLCIKQDDSRDKAIQILRMRQIYQKATFTLIAASGKNADAGLEFHDSSIGDIRTMDDIYKTSVWRTRGWTYQEDVLSCRQVIFSCTGLYFNCQNQLQRVFKDPKVPTRDFIQNKTSLLRTLTLPGCQLQAYCQAVMEYTTRDLTFETDLLNAFQGIIQCFGAKMDDIPNLFYYGLPTSSFDQMFCWDTEYHQPLTRRSEWPSWS